MGNLVKGNVAGTDEEMLRRNATKSEDASAKTQAA
jgi:hypothetical protein